MPYLDKAKQAAAARRHYENNTTAMKARARAFTTKNQKHLKRLSDTLKAKPCVDCAVEYPPHVMDFDHVRGQKRNDVANLVRRSVSEVTLLAEIAKCEVVCSNCHRERTHQRSA